MTFLAGTDSGDRRLHFDDGRRWSGPRTTLAFTVALVLAAEGTRWLLARSRSRRGERDLAQGADSLARAVTGIQTARIDSCDARIGEIVEALDHLCGCLGIRVESPGSRRPDLRLIRGRPAG